MLLTFMRAYMFRNETKTTAMLDHRYVNFNLMFINSHCYNILIVGDLNQDGMYHCANKLQHIFNEDHSSFLQNQ